MSNAALKHHRKRLRAERYFLCKCKTALALAILALCVLLVSIVGKGVSGFFVHEIKLSVTLNAENLGLQPGQALKEASASAFTRSIQAALKARFPEAEAGGIQRELFAVMGSGAARALKKKVTENEIPCDTLTDIWLPISSKADLYLKNPADPQNAGRLSEPQIAWLQTLKTSAEIQKIFNSGFFTESDSRQPEQAGFLGAIMGSLLLMLVCLAVAFPLGVMTAVYLEEFATPGALVDMIEVNINNLAAVPSIVFGLLGLAFYLNFLHLPRSSTLVGGLTLAMMILPVIIIATRSALRSVPDSIRDAARALGATPLQVVWHHTLPLSMPGIMTGTILGLARAIGETAPLLMIGMVAFVADKPNGFTSPATVMPVQIYLWASSPEAGYVEKTAAGIMVLLALLLSMNALAIYIRKKFEVRW